MVSFFPYLKKTLLYSRATAKLDPSYHSPPYTTLSAHQFRLETARKARVHVANNKSTAKTGHRGGASGSNRVVGSELPNPDSDKGSCKIRGLETRYTWFRTESPTPILGPGPTPKMDTVEPGSLRVHHYEGGNQVWVLEPVKGVTKRQLHWVAAAQGHGPHPAQAEYYLQVDSEEHKLPTWVKRHTLTTYASKKRKSKEATSVSGSGAGGGTTGEDPARTSTTVRLS